MLENGIISIKGARTHNLKNLDLDIPRGKFVVVTGVSGSGKSSLALDLIAREGQRRYLETLPTFSRQYAGKLAEAEVDEIRGLSPTIAIGQYSRNRLANRSTVGTLSDLNGLLRLLFARLGETVEPIKLTRSLFSFNSEEGQCPTCKGIGEKEEIDIDKLVADPNKTLREGALAPTLPTGYIMYSQVTVDALNQVCEAEGFSVDIAWNKLTDEQRNVILNGSDKVKVPFGKHSIESRLKWSGIKAKPREEGFYKGMLPIMSDILRRDRNPNILKYVSAVTCPDCMGKRLNAKALSVQVGGKTIDQLWSMSLRDLNEWLTECLKGEVAKAIGKKMRAQLELLIYLGLGQLTLADEATALSGSEIQRIRIANQLSADLTDIIYVVDEPGLGLTRDELHRITALLRHLVNKGNTVVTVEHDPDLIRLADWIVDIGPAAGVNGGEVLFNGPLSQYLETKLNSPTHQVLTGAQDEVREKRQSREYFLFKNGKAQVNGINAITGPRRLVNEFFLQGELLAQLNLAPENRSSNLGVIEGYQWIDQKPIGRTPRSNPATYLGISDHIRDLFAKLPAAKDAGLKKSHFSFNTKGGRCEECLGAGKNQVGMHFLGTVDLVCGTCGGKRFNLNTLQIAYKNRSIADIYGLSIYQAIDLFADAPKVLKGLHALRDIGLGYLTLGQSATTLSGGEAQRIKLANELQKLKKGHQLYLFENPTAGLHPKDIKVLVNVFDQLIDKGHTVFCFDESAVLHGLVDHQLDFDVENKADFIQPLSTEQQSHNAIEMKGVKTHQLKNIDVSFPKRKLSVVTGISGSGKSSLVYKTLYAAAENQFAAAFSTYQRTFIKQDEQGDFDTITGLNPVIALQKKKSTNGRSTVGTVTGLDAHYRLLYSRLAEIEGKSLTAQHFSANHKLGACTNCNGLGTVLKSVPEVLIEDWEATVFEGGFIKNKVLNYYTDKGSQFMATLQTVADHKGWNLTELKWNNIPDAIWQVLFYGTGDQVWTSLWRFKNKTREGEQEISAPWKGFCNYINEEYELRKNNKNIKALEALLVPVLCATCKGEKLKPERQLFTLEGVSIAGLSKLSLLAASRFIKKILANSNAPYFKIAQAALKPALRLIHSLLDLGLGYISVDRKLKTLSGGELQRVNLAGQISANLSGVTYVLDEPSIGLDKGQNKQLILLLKQLVDNGNTVVLIEHSSDFIAAADYVVELGPGAGAKGGELIFQGSIADLKKQPQLRTAQLLAQVKAVKPVEVEMDSSEFGVKGASLHNLNGVDLSLQSKRINCIAGVSGSGKSTLMKAVLWPSFIKGKAVHAKNVFGNELFDQVVYLDQQQPSASRLESPSTYLGFLDKVAAKLAKLPAAKTAGLKKNDFVYSHKNGACPTCKGYGATKTEMDFMSPIWTVCETCNGGRYKAEVKTVLAGEWAVNELLQKTFSEIQADAFFKQETELLEWLLLLGLGHLELGQPLQSLSTGEFQRLRLVKALMQGGGSTLFLFDEPGTGLHYDDLLQLIKGFNRLINEGHTVVYIEHHQELIQTAHELRVLGPGSGADGGRLVKAVCQ